MRVKTGSFYKKGGPQYRVGSCGLREKARVPMRYFRGMVGPKGEVWRCGQRRSQDPALKFHLRSVTGIVLIELFEYVTI